MNSFFAVILFLVSFSAFADKPMVINCTIGANYDYSVLINLTSKKVELWEMAGSGVAYPSLMSDTIIKQGIKGNILTLETKATGHISITTAWKQGGWGEGTWKHNRLLDSRLKYADPDSNANGSATLFECVDWTYN